MKKLLIKTAIVFAVATLLAMAFISILFVVAYKITPIIFSVIFLISFLAVKKTKSEDKIISYNNFLWFIFAMACSIISVAFVCVFGYFFKLDMSGLPSSWKIVPAVMDSYGWYLILTVILGVAVSLIHDLIKRKVPAIRSDRKVTLLRLLGFQGLISALFTVVLISGYLIKYYSFEVFDEATEIMIVSSLLYFDLIFVPFPVCACLFYAFYRIGNNTKMLMLSVPVCIGFEVAAFLIIKAVTQGLNFATYFTLGSGALPFYLIPYFCIMLVKIIWVHTKNRKMKKLEQL